MLAFQQWVAKKGMLCLRWWQAIWKAFRPKSPQRSTWCHKDKSIILIKKCYSLLTADVWGSPCNTHSSLIASLSVGCDSWAETLTVSSSVAGTRVFHTVIIEGLGINLCVYKTKQTNIRKWTMFNFLLQQTELNYSDLMVAVFECLPCYDAAHHFCPLMSHGCSYTRIHNLFLIWASALNFPAVCKL